MTSYEPKFVLRKEASHECAVVGQKIIYTIHAANNDQIPFTDVVVYDVLDPSLKFEEGSIKVDGLPFKEANIFSGVVIGMLRPGETRIITFEAQVINRVNCEANNQAVAEFYYHPPGETLVETQVSSNIYEVKLYIADIQVRKRADKEEVNIGEELTYEVEIENTGDLVAKGVRFIDEISPETRLIEGSVKIEDQVVNGVQLDKGIVVGKICPGNRIKLTYKVKIVHTNRKGLIVNHANATFRYELPCEGTGILVGEPVSVTTYTKINISTFKQFSIESYLCIPEVKPCMEALNSVTGSMSIKGCHVIETPQVVSVENQILTGYKLIIHGVLNVVIEYTALEPTQSVHSAHYDVPFSTFVILPPDYKMGSKLDISGTVEDIYYQGLDIRYFFMNATTLVNVKILSC